MATFWGRFNLFNDVLIYIYMYMISDKGTRSLWGSGTKESRTMTSIKARSAQESPCRTGMRRAQKTINIHSGSKAKYEEEHQKSCFLGSLCLSGRLRPYCVQI